jgi:hypothetical protein
MVDEVPINGDEFRLTLRVGDYKRAATGDVWDDNWLRGSVELDIAQLRRRLSEPSAMWRGRQPSCTRSTRASARCSKT